MLASVVLFSVLICSTTALHFCFPELLYEFTDDFTASQGSGYVQIVGSVNIVNNEAVFASDGILKFHKLSGYDWRGVNLLSFTFLPEDSSLNTEIGIMSNSLTSDTGSLMVSWYGNELNLKVILQTWDATAVKYVIRTEVLTISGLDMTVTQSVRLSIDSDEIRFQSSPLLDGSIPEPVSLSLKHDEHIKFAGWDPLTFGTGTSVRFSGELDDFTYFKCEPLDAFKSNTNATTTEQTTVKATIVVTDA